MLDNAPYIVVEGPIGAGKTSLANRLAERLAAEMVLEQPERNPFLERFYQDLDRWSLATQLAFLMQRTEQVQHLEALRQANHRVVSDFLFDKDLLFAELNLPEDEYRLYTHMHQAVAPTSVRVPDLVIYLQAGVDTLITRVRKRGMEAERRISESYLEQVAERYARFFYEYEDAPLFIVDAKHLNPIESDEDLELLLDRLNSMRSFREFFNYAI